MPRKRLNRKEKQAHTRDCLMASAGKVFARRGLQQASIDEVAEDAGYTKGAFYANFKNKEELFLAMLDDRFNERIEQIERSLELEGDMRARTEAAGADFAHYVSADPEWQRIFFEFTTHAARDEDFRQELLTRYRSMRDRLADALRRSAPQLQDHSPIPLEEVALMICMMGNAFALEKLIEGDELADEVYVKMLTIFFTGLKTLGPADRAPALAGAAGEAR